MIDGTHSYSYSYNEDGLRLSKDVDGEVTEYYYNGSVLMYMVTGSGSTAVKQRFSYDAAGNLVAVVYKNGTSTAYTYYYLRNAQGDIVKLIDSSGNTVVEYLYDSWGKPISVTGTMAATLGADQPFRYRGYVYDEETGWYYLQSRYYDPTTCRFTSADVLLSTGQGVIGHNAFAYCLSDPVNLLDNLGSAAHRNGNNRVDLPDYATGYTEKPTVLIGGLNPKSEMYKKLRQLYIDDYSSNDSHYLIIVDVEYIGRRDHKNSFWDKLATFGGSSTVAGAGSTVIGTVFKGTSSVLGPVSLVFSAVGVASLIAEPELISNGTYNYYTVKLCVYIKTNCHSDYELSQRSQLTFFWYDAYDSNSFWVTE